jgi:hypothetical protein
MLIFSTSFVAEKINMVELVEIAPGRFRVKKTPQNFARSEHPLPYVISDLMPPTEQVDGKFYTSKRAFRAVGRANGLTEVGNEKFKPKQRASEDRGVKESRIQSVKAAIEKYKAGHRRPIP